jgi:organic radical activating enzyme
MTMTRKAPLTVLRDVDCAYNSHFHHQDGDYDYDDYDDTGGEPLEFTSIDDYVEDLRTRLKELVTHPVQVYQYPQGWVDVQYDFSKIIVNPYHDAPKMEMTRQKSKEEILAEQRAKEKAKVRREAAAKKKRDAEIALLQTLKAKYESPQIGI